MLHMFFTWNIFVLRKTCSLCFFYGEARHRHDPQPGVRTRDVQTSGRPDRPECSECTGEVQWPKSSSHRKTSGRPPGPSGASRHRSGTKAAFDRFDRLVDWSIGSIDSIDSIFENKKKQKMQLLGKLSQTFQDSFELDSDSDKSRDDRLNSPKSGIFCFCHFWAN